MGQSCSSLSKPPDDTLLAAIRDGDDLTVRDHLTALRAGAQPSKYYVWSSNVAALHGASNEGHLGVVRVLVDVVRPGPHASTREKQAFLAFLDRCNTYGQTPLMLACKNGHSEVVKFLLRAGADPLVPDKVHSRTCLHYAAWNGWADCIHLLLSEDCKVRLFNGLIGGAHRATVKDACGTSRMVDMRSESGFTPLHFAVSASNAAAVKMLLEKGASLTAAVLQGACYSIWPTGSTPLHIAAAKGSASIVRQLLQAQAANATHHDVRTSFDTNGKRPVDISRHLQHTRLEPLLDPAVPLAQAILPHSHRGSRSQGCPALTVLAGKAVQSVLLGQLDFLAWQLRLRDGAAAAMPRSLKRQLMKAGKSSKSLRSGRQEHVHAHVPVPQPQAPSSSPPAASASPTAAATEGGESQVSSDSEDKDGPGSSKRESKVQAASAQLEEPGQAGIVDPSPAHEDADGHVCVAAGCAADSGDEDDEAPALVARGSACGGYMNECGVCLDRQTQLLVGECHHECCYECALTLVRKTKLSKTSIRCPFCRGVIGSFQLKDKAGEPVIVKA